MAVSTDLNPGTSPLMSLRLAMNLACTLFRLTPKKPCAVRRRMRPRHWGWPIGGDWWKGCGRISRCGG